jgi:hypothetical protein
MKRVLAMLMCLAGGALFLLGLLFLVGAGGAGHRYAIAVVALGAGAALLGFGVRGFRAADADSPEQILAEVLELARHGNGEVSELEVCAALGRRASLVPPVLAKLVEEKLCERRAKDGSTFYLFADLQPRLFVKKCRYCGAELSIASQAPKCPRCGGELASAVARHAVSADAYKMDETP